MAHARDAQWKLSEKSFRHAIELDPSRSLSHEHFAAFLLLPLGRIEEALREMRAAEKTDPLSPTVQYWLVYVLFSAGRYEEAAGHCEKVLEGRKSQCLGRALLGRGRIGEAIRVLEADRTSTAAISVKLASSLGAPSAMPMRGRDAARRQRNWQPPGMGTRCFKPSRRMASRQVNLWCSRSSSSPRAESNSPDLS
jgi:tetratricopeptide (TPR) repeat protein